MMMNETSKTATETRGAVVRGLVTAFTVMGTLSLGFAFPAMLVGAFTGPHVLIVAGMALSLGIASIAVGCGIAGGSRSAEVCGAMLAAIVAVASACWAIAGAMQVEEEWPMRLLFGLWPLTFGAPYAVAAVMILRLNRNRRSR